MKHHYKFIAALAMLVATPTAFAQSNFFKKGTDKRAYAQAAQDTIRLEYARTMRTVNVISTKPFTLGTPSEAWLSGTLVGNGAVRVQAQMSDNIEAARVASIPMLIDGEVAGHIVVKQAVNRSASELVGTRAKITWANASSVQAGSGDIAKSYDGNPNTIYHSNWSTSGQFPITLEYALEGAPHVDYMMYVPRSDGNGNGNFGKITIAYSTKDNPTSYTKLSDRNFGQSSAVQEVAFGSDGIDNVARVKITIHNGSAGFASAAEIGFYTKKDGVKSDIEAVFTDELCTALKPGVTDAQIEALRTPYLRLLAKKIKAGNYSTEFRVGEFEPFEPYGTLSKRLKTWFNYSHYENPTGIYFEEGVPVVVFVKGLPEGKNTSLTIKNFGRKYENEPQSRSNYVLKNGHNIIVPSHRGNGYVSYYTPDYATAPNIRVHFAMAKETGYFDVTKHDNAKWRSLLANAVSDIMDIKGRKLLGAYPVARLLQHAPTDGVAMATNGDRIVQIQHDLLGFDRYGITPKNHMQAMVTWSGFLYASTEGAYAHDNSIWAFCAQDINRLDLWGMPHELGHVNQMGPNWHYSGLKEVTNNLNALMAQYTLRRAGGLRLEENESYRGQSFFEYALRLGQPWLNQEGGGKYFPAKHGEQQTIELQNYDGTWAGRDTTVRMFANDVMMTLLPLWQLQLYGEIAGFAPHIWAKTHQGIRQAIEESRVKNGSGGRYQIDMMRIVCDSTGIDFLPFFEKVGMLKPINSYIGDYSNGWQRINQEMIDELRAYVASRNLQPLQGYPWFITGVTVDSYKNRANIPTTNEVGAGCTPGGAKQVYGNSYNTILVSMTTWPNVVCFETYDADGNLLHYTMPGFGGGYGQNKTYVLFPSNAKTIKAVNWDGTQRVTVYVKS